MEENKINIPKHIGIIVDGNRRWAKNKNLPFLEGHRRGLENVKKIGEWCRKKGIKILTIFAFSTENWQRPQKEVNYLLKLLSSVFSDKNIKELNQKGVKIKAIGQVEKFPKNIQEKIKKAEKLTENNKERILNLAVSYGGRADVVHAVKKIIEKEISIQEITEKTISENLWTNFLPDPDLIIRTGGEKRVSNFLLWQTAYSEFYFTDKLWPDFTEQDLDRALEDYGLRQRRFGK